MSKETDLAAIARRYIDLWQDQLLAVASDPDTVSVLTKIMAFAGSGLDAQSARWRELCSLAAGPVDARTTPQPEAVPDASPDRSCDLAEFAHRLATLEQRIGLLEAERRPARRTTGRRRSRDSAP